MIVNQIQQSYIMLNNRYAIDTLKATSKRVNQKTAEATRDLIHNRIANRITKFSSSSPQSKSETITNELNKGILNETYISLQKSQKPINDFNDKFFLKKRQINYLNLRQKVINDEERVTKIIKLDFKL